jgi:pyruvate kinase
MERKTCRTKIICSLEKSTFNADLIQSAKSTIDGLRIVWSAETSADVEKFLQQITDPKTKKPIVSTILDVSSLSRVYIVNQKAGEEWTVGTKLTIGATEKADVQLNSMHWSANAKVGDQVLIGYGTAIVKVLSMDGTQVNGEVIQGGVIFNGMDVHAPSSKRAAFNEDLGDEPVRIARKYNCDYVLVSNVDDAEALKKMRKKLEGSDPASMPWLVLRLDCDRVYGKYRELLPYVDGVMISRMELALTIDPAMVPLLTKEIIQVCNDAAKIVFTASEILGSMRTNATPTRAEVSDIANAVSDGTDAVILSEAVPHGPYALRAIDLINKIVVDIERNTELALNWQKHEPYIENEMDAIAYSAYKTAQRTQASAIVCITESGNTALRLSSFRTPIPIIAVTFSQKTMSRLNLVRGVESIMLDTAPKIDEVLLVVTEQLKRDSWLKTGDTIIFVSITLSSIGRENSNLFTVQRLA